MNRHLTLISGHGHRLPAGTVRPTDKGGHVGAPRTSPRPPRTSHPAVPMYDWTAETESTVMHVLTLVENELVIEALVELGTGNSLRPGRLAAMELAKAMRKRTSDLRPIVEADQADPHGMPRPS
jgi:hypothetical protein